LVCAELGGGVCPCLGEPGLQVIADAFKVADLALSFLKMALQSVMRDREHHRGRAEHEQWADFGNSSEKMGHFESFRYRLNAFFDFAAGPLSVNRSIHNRVLATSVP
jgi:hypothetical protein